jgi:hypothetical protein
VIAYWLSTSFVLVASLLTRAASEEPPFHEEKQLIWLTAASFVLSAVIGVACVRGRIGVGWFGLWAAQTSLVAVAWVMTLDAGGVRVAPPVVVVCLLGQAAGLVALVLSYSGRAHATNKT